MSTYACSRGRSIALFAGRFQPLADSGTIAFHYLYPPLSIGLGVVLVLMEGLWLSTQKPVYHQLARFWTKVFALTFAMCVATGIVMEF